jgi:hypothetical protein
MSCKYLRNLGGDNQPCIWDCDKVDCYDVTTCGKGLCGMYKEYIPKQPKPTHTIHLTEKQAKRLLFVMDDTPNGQPNSKIDQKIVDKLKEALHRNIDELSYKLRAMCD